MEHQNGRANEAEVVSRGREGDAFDRVNQTQAMHDRHIGTAHCAREQLVAPYGVNITHRVGATIRPIAVV